MTVPAYTFRRKKPSTASDDYVFRYRGTDVGRCYLRGPAEPEHKWYWTIYIRAHVSRLIEGVPIAGHADMLDDAKVAFRKSFDAMLDAGVVRLQRGRQSE